MVAEPPTAIKIFYCYAHEDRALRDELEKHLSPLKRMGQITEWHDRDIQAGTNWAQEIKTHLNTASIILLLVSPDFMSSDYCWSVEMTRALERHKSGEARVIPIILRRCDWEETPIGELQALPPEGKPISLWTDKDEAFWNVIKGIRATVKLLLTQMQQAEEERIRKVAEEEQIRKAWEPWEHQAQKVEEAIPPLTKPGSSSGSQMREQWGNYYLIRSIGHGSNSDVYLGKHINLGTQAAIKVLNTVFTSSEIEQFYIQARVITSLVHPNIAQLLDFGSKNLTPFLIMYYAPNGTLLERHPRGTQLSIPTIISYVKQIAAALQYAHDRNVIHQDVKPDNMLVGRNNEVLLNDFPIFQGSKLLDNIAYMAPEMFRGQPCAASDQYSLGVVVYEWLRGNLPDQSFFMVRYATGDHLLPPLPLLREKVPTLSTAMYQVVHKALDNEPMRRFASVQGFATALEVASRDVV